MCVGCVCVFKKIYLSIYLSSSSSSICIYLAIYHLSLYHHLSIKTEKKTYFREFSYKQWGLASLKSSGGPGRLKEELMLHSWVQRQSGSRILSFLGNSVFFLKAFSGLDEAHHIMEDNLLYSVSIDLKVNVI